MSSTGTPSSSTTAVSSSAGLESLSLGGGGGGKPKSVESGVMNGGVGGGGRPSPSPGSGPPSKPTSVHTSSHSSRPHIHHDLERDASAHPPFWPALVSPSSHSDLPPLRAALTADQEAKYAKVLAWIDDPDWKAPQDLKGWKAIGGGNGKPVGLSKEKRNAALAGTASDPSVARTPTRDAPDEHKHHHLPHLSHHHHHSKGSQPATPPPETLSASSTPSKKLSKNSDRMHLPPSQPSSSSITSLFTSSTGASGAALPAGVDLTPLSEREKCFLTKECLLRYLRAVKYDLAAALARVEEVVVWRREYGVDADKEDLDLHLTPSRTEVEGKKHHGTPLTAEEVEEESRTGKQFTLGYDVHSRPCLHMYPYRQVRLDLFFFHSKKPTVADSERFGGVRQNTKVSQRQIRFVVWCLERTIDLMPPGVESLALLIDFGTGKAGGGGQRASGSHSQTLDFRGKKKSADVDCAATTLGQARTVLTILQTYYAERLGRAICVNVPFLFWGFYKLVGPFIDPVTKEKIRFNPDTKELVPREQLEKDCFGGDLDFKYVSSRLTTGVFSRRRLTRVQDHATYYPLLTKLAAERREAMFQRWKRYGNDHCGASEWVLRGGDEEGNTSSSGSSVMSRTGTGAGDATTPKLEKPVHSPSVAAAGGAAAVVGGAVAASAGVANEEAEKKDEATEMPKSEKRKSRRPRYAAADRGDSVFGDLPPPDSHPNSPAPAGLGPDDDAEGNSLERSISEAFYTPLEPSSTTARGSFPFMTPADADQLPPVKHIPLPVAIFGGKAETNEEQMNQKAFEEALGHARDDDAASLAAKKTPMPYDPDRAATSETFADSVTTSGTGTPTGTGKKHRSGTHGFFHHLGEEMHKVGHAIIRHPSPGHHGHHHHGKKDDKDKADKDHKAESYKEGQSPSLSTTHSNPVSRTGSSRGLFGSHKDKGKDATPTPATAGTATPTSQTSEPAAPAEATKEQEPVKAE